MVNVNETNKTDSTNPTHNQAPLAPGQQAELEKLAALAEIAAQLGVSDSITRRPPLNPEQQKSTHKKITNFGKIFDSKLNQRK